MEDMGTPPASDSGRIITPGPEKKKSAGIQETPRMMGLLRATRGRNSLEEFLICE
jgi:hypothetical protein